MEACFNAAAETYVELSTSNANFKRVYESMAAVRREGYLWWQLSEFGFDGFMMGQQRKRLL
jgi:TRAP-type mannitol/chloroaromatic compound transport system substrate-binding protein